MIYTQEDMNKAILTARKVTEFVSNLGNHRWSEFDLANVVASSDEAFIFLVENWHKVNGFEEIVEKMREFSAQVHEGVHVK